MQENAKKYNSSWEGRSRHFPLELPSASMLKFWHVILAQFPQEPGLARLCVVFGNLARIFAPIYRIWMPPGLVGGADGLINEGAL